MHPRHLVACALASMALTGADAQTVYRWVDEAGRVHYSDVVPDAYRKSALPVEAKAAPTASEQADALARAAAQKAAAERIVPPAADDAAPSAPPSAAERAPEAFRYTAANCKAWRRRYAHSKACFDGSTGPEDRPTASTYQTCGEDVPNPYPVCGAPENYEVDPAEYPWFYIPPHHRH